MKAKIRFAGMLIAALSASSGAWAAKVTNIKFENKGSASQIEIESDSPLTYEKQENAQDKQIVLELKDAQLGAYAKRKIDTSSFASKVSLISPYQVQGQNDSRVVIQLRESASPTFNQSGNVIRVSIPTSQAAADEAPPADAATEEASAAPAPSEPENAPEAPPAAADQAPTPIPPAQVAAEERKVQKSSLGTVGDRKPLDVFFETRDTKQFIGKKITLQLREAELIDVFQLIGEASGFNVVVGDDVKGKITLTLVDTPWDQALDLILHTRQLGAERNNNVLRIMTLTMLTTEKQAELAAKKATEATAPRVTRIFPISYAKLADLQQVFQKFGTTNTQDANQSTAVLADERTNSIIVRDTAENLDRMKKLIELLDTQTPQVLIESKIVEVTDNNGNTSEGGLSTLINGTYGGTSASFGSIAATDPRFSGSDPDLQNVLGPSSAVTGFGAAGSGKSSFFGKTFPQSWSFGFLPGWKSVGALLNLAESEDKLRVLSSPKTVVLNKENAKITSMQPVLSTTVSQTPTGPVQTTTVDQAELSLDVTPTVTNDGGILMDLKIKRDAVLQAANAVAGAGQQKAPRELKTRVLVDSGMTLVIGGIYTRSETDSSSGFPFLRKIPILGTFFGKEAKEDDRTELMIFIAPKILNEREAGFTAGT